MTRDELLARYDLIEQVTEGEVETHHALHQSGAVVMVHFLNGSPRRNTTVVQGVRRLGAGEGSSGKVLHVHDVDGRPVIVTRFITDFVSLEHWLAALGIPVAEVEAGGDETLILQPGEGLGGPLGTAPVLEPPPPAPEPPPASPESTPPHHPSSTPRPPTAPSPPPQPAAGGEFTRMFSAVPPTEAPPPVHPDQALTVETPRPPPLNPPPAPPEAPPSASPAPPVPPAPPPPAAPGAGEFTQMFKAPLSQDPEERPTVQRPPGGGVEAPRGGSPQVPPAPPSSPPVPPPPAPGSGEFTKLFRAAPSVEPDRNPWTDPARRPPEPSGPPRPSQPVPPPASSAPTSPAPPDGPGEFTKFFKPPEPPREPSGGPEPLRYDQTGGGAGRPDPSKPPQAPDRAWSDALRSSTPSAQPPPPPPPPPQDEAGGGEFTQIFGRDTIPVPAPPPVAPGSGGPAQTPGAAPPPPAASVPPAPPAPPPRPSSPPAGLPTPRKPRLPGPEALLRGGGVHVPRPRMPIAPQPRQLGQMAVRAVQSAPSAGGAAGSGPAEGAPAGGEAKPGKGTRALAVGIGAVLVLSLVLTLFFALWDFSEPAPEADATAQPAGEAQVSPADSVG